MLHGKQLATGSTPTNRLNLGGSEGQIANFDSSQMLASTSLINASPTSLTIQGDMVVSNANIDVNGNLVQLNTETISFGDTVVEINTGGASGNIGFSINRGSDLDTSFYYDQSSDVWKMDTLVGGSLVTKSVLLEDVMTAADGVLSTAVGAETARSAAARVLIAAALAAATALRISEDGTLTSTAANQLSTINGWISASNTAIVDETARALAQEAAIQAKLAAQVIAAGVSEVNLTGLVSAQISEAQGEEGDLSSAIIAASLSATTAENALSGATIAQRLAAQTAEGALDGNVDTEISRQNGEDGTLHTNTHGALVSYLNEEIRHDAELATLDAYIAAKIVEMQGDGTINLYNTVSETMGGASASVHKNFGAFVSSEYNDLDPQIVNHAHHHVVTKRNTHVIPSGAGVTSGTYTITLDDTTWDFNSEAKITIGGLEISDDSYTWTWEGEASPYALRPGQGAYMHNFTTTPKLKTIVIDVDALGYSLDVGDNITITYNVFFETGFMGIQPGEFGCNDASYIGGDADIEQNNPALCIDQLIFTDKANASLTVNSAYFSYEAYSINEVKIVNQATGAVVLSKVRADLDGSDIFSLSGFDDGVYTLTLTHGGSAISSYTDMSLTDGITTFGGGTNVYTAAYPAVVSGSKTIIPFTINQTAAAGGCMDPSACNYDSSAVIDDGTCTYPEANYDCDGNCIVAEDCNGDCGGTEVNDACGECGGDGSSCA
tara:strand:- start:5537 stop:7705 length:2169 start_codon:yes stop_codon:yes gene_type:complete